VADAIDFLREVWLALEPGATSFAALDLHLMRQSLEVAFLGTTGRPSGQAWEGAVAVMLEEQTDEGLSRDELRAFILRQSDPDDARLLALASQAGDPTEANHHMRVMARALLLLRVASRTCARFLDRASIDFNDLRSWWERFGEERGIWAPGIVPEPLTDLWADVQAALDDLEEITRDEPRATASYHGLMELCARPMAVLSGSERAALWSLAA
jgi:hypothetical protein